MPTPTFVTGFEHGKVVVGGAMTPTNDKIFTTVTGVPTINTTTPRSGSQCMESTTAVGAGVYVQRTFSGGATKTQVTMSFAVRFVGSLPSADCMIFCGQAALGGFCNAVFQASDSKIYAANGTAKGATGVAVVADQWYVVDISMDVSAGTRVTKVQVDGVACGDASSAIAASTMSTWRMGVNVATTTANATIRFDDLVVSETIGDYPMGNHEVLKLSPNSDGTHSFTLNDFVYGDAGASVPTNATDVWSNLDEAPFGAIGTTDSIQQNVIRATGYVEVNFEDSPRTVNAWAVQIHGQFDADASGASTSGMRLWDGTTEVTLYGPPNGDVSNVDAETFTSFCRATNPSAGAWTTTAINQLRARWGFADDVTGSPIIHALMLEVAFPFTPAAPPPRRRDFAIVPLI